MLPAATWETLSPKLYQTFWTLSLYDIAVPKARYELEITRQRRQVKEIDHFTPPIGGELDPKAAAALVKACGGKQAVYDALEMTLTRSAEALLGQRSKSARAEWSKTPARIAKVSATPSHPRPGKLNFESTKRRPMSARQ